MDFLYHTNHMWGRDIDVAVIVPTYGNSKMELSKKLWHDVGIVSYPEKR